MIRPDPFGILDLLVALLLIYTESAIPESILLAHASFLIYKGLGSIVKPIPLPAPVYILGGFADIISAAILLTGNPPFLVDYMNYLAGALLIKGVWTMVGLMAR